MKGNLLAFLLVLGGFVGLGIYDAKYVDRSGSALCRNIYGEVVEVKYLRYEHNHGRYLLTTDKGRKVYNECEIQ